MSARIPEGTPPRAAELDLAHRMARDLGIDGPEFDATYAKWQEDFAPFEKALRESQIITAEDLATRVTEVQP